MALASGAGLALSPRSVVGSRQLRDLLASYRRSLVGSLWVPGIVDMKNAIFLEGVSPRVGSVMADSVARALLLWRSKGIKSECGGALQKKLSFAESLD